MAGKRGFRNPVSRRAFGQGLAGGELHTVPALYARISAQDHQPLIPDRIPSLCCRERISHESTPNP
jgi:hypothetical protein